MTFHTIDIRVKVSGTDYAIGLTASCNNLTEPNIDKCRTAAVDFLTKCHAARKFKPSFSVTNPDASDGLALKVAREMELAQEGLSKLSKQTRITIYFSRVKLN